MYLIIVSRYIVCDLIHVLDEFMRTNYINSQKKTILVGPSHVFVIMQKKHK
jgi:hypothetical protein